MGFIKRFLAARKYTQPIHPCDTNDSFNLLVQCRSDYQTAEMKQMLECLIHTTLKIKQIETYNIKMNKLAERLYDLEDKLATLEARFARKKKREIKVKEKDNGTSK